MNRNNKPMSVKLIDLFCFFVVAYILLLNYTITHEDVHVEVLRHDGCQEVYKHIDYTLGLMGGSYVMCLDPSYVESDIAQDHNVYNEIIGYNTLSVILTLIGCCLFLKICD